ncbi:MAG: FHA domain-containing protein, partial [Acidobacteria bacterium]|nr:FHA domain-containing protein [Acidobacteriota bacterium]
MPLRLLVDLAPRPLRLTLREGESILGSGNPETGIELQVTHPSVSRRHAKLLLDGEELLVEDLGSSNGTWVGGRRISGPTPVSLVTALRFGGVEARLERVETEDLEPAISLAGAER